MSHWLQHAIVLTLAAAAAVWLTRRFWRTFAATRGGSSCGCGGSDCLLRAELQRKLREASREAAARKSAS